jgi:Putative Ig domain
MAIACNSAQLARSHSRDAVAAATVYVKMVTAAYNLPMNARPRRLGIFLILQAALWGQSATPDQLTIVSKQLPAASLWTAYTGGIRPGFKLEAQGGIEPYHWRIVNGILPNGLKLDERGEITGAPLESGSFQFALDLRDSNNPPTEVQQRLTLVVETPFAVEWDRKAEVNGQRVEGAVKVSNRTGRDLDLTFVVLAVNNIGRATAIGYQHFALKRNTRDMSLPFGDNLPPGEYNVNIDAVGEEPVSNRIFRARMVTKQTVSQGP